MLLGFGYLYNLVFFYFLFFFQDKILNFIFLFLLKIGSVSSITIKGPKTKLFIICCTNRRCTLKEQK